MPKSRNILVCPLDWGIGHATRCVPLIRVLLKNEVNVILGTSGHAGNFLKSEFPDLQNIDFNEYGIVYPAKGNMALKMIMQAPALLQSIKKEHQLLNQVIETHKLDAVISDNRFGLWSKKIPGIYITHQLNIKAPAGYGFTEAAIFSMHKKYINHFTECWIPDLPEKGISGDLAHGKRSPVPSFFIGPQSRFKQEEATKYEKKYDIMAIISGPEPQRSIFEKIMLEQLMKFPGQSMVLLGRPGSELNIDSTDNVQIYNHMDTGKMQDTMLSSALIICRPGYSSIMDLAVLGKRSVFVPTPGQTEQEYLADFHMKERHYYAMKQKDFSLEKAIRGSRNYPGLMIKTSQDVLHQRVEKLLSLL